MDFTFDADISSLTEEKSESSRKDLVQASKSLDSEVQQSVSITSPGTDDLGLKIASCKNVWASPTVMPPVYEQLSSASSIQPSAMSTAQSITTVASTSANSSQPYATFTGR